MRFEPPLVAGVLLKRYKRFLADVHLPSGVIVTAHCANTGAMRGCAPEGARVLLSYHTDPKRKLPYSWELVFVDESWVGINTAKANGIVKEAIEKGLIPELLGYETLEAERAYGENSRIDWLLSRASGDRCYVEVKSVTLALGDVALFPDAVTTRGTKHLNELINQARAGDRAVMLFLIQREDCMIFKPAASIDTCYAATLTLCAQAGVELLAYACTVNPGGIEVERAVPIELP